MVRDEHFLGNSTNRYVYESECAPKICDTFSVVVFLYVTSLACEEKMAPLTRDLLFAIFLAISVECRPGHVCLDDLCETQGPLQSIMRCSWKGELTYSCTKHENVVSLAFDRFQNSVLEGGDFPNLKVFTFSWSPFDQRQLCDFLRLKAGQVVLVSDGRKEETCRESSEAAVGSTTTGPTSRSTVEPTSTEPILEPTTATSTAGLTTAKPIVESATTGPVGRRTTAPPTTVRPLETPTTTEPTAAPTTIRPFETPTAGGPTTRPTTINKGQVLGSTAETAETEEEMSLGAYNDVVTNINDIKLYPLVLSSAFIMSGISILILSILLFLYKLNKKLSYCVEKWNRKIPKRDYDLQVRIPLLSSEDTGSNNNVDECANDVEYLQSEGPEHLYEESKF